jgi:hypothetical protein
MQALAPGPDGGVVAAGFSGTGFTTSGGCEVPEDTFFYLQLDASGAIAQPIGLSITSGEQPVISLARGPNGLLLATSRGEKLSVQSLDKDNDGQLLPGQALLTCTGVKPAGGQTPPQILQGRVVSNGEQVAVVAQVQANVQYDCYVQQQHCPVVPTAPGLMLWSPNGDVNCDQLQFLEAPNGSDYAAPRLALGPPAPMTEVMLMMHRKGTGGSDQMMAETTLDGYFGEWTHTPLGPQAGLVLPTVPTTGNAVLAGVVGLNDNPALDAAFIRRAADFAPITDNTDWALLDAPDGGTNSRITALHSTENHVLAVAQVDQSGAAIFGPPNSLCGPGPCGMWSLFDTKLTRVGHQPPSPGVFPSAGLLVANQDGEPDVVWAGSYDAPFSLPGGAQLNPAPGARSAFIARQAPLTSAP